MSSRGGWLCRMRQLRGATGQRRLSLLGMMSQWFQLEVRAAVQAGASLDGEQGYWHRCQSSRAGSESLDGGVVFWRQCLFQGMCEAAYSMCIWTSKHARFEQKCLRWRAGVLASISQKQSKQRWPRWRSGILEARSFPRRV